MEVIRTVLISAGISFITVGAFALVLPAFEGVLGGKIAVVILGIILLTFGIRLSK